MSKFKNQNATFYYMQYRISQRIIQVFAFTALAIDKTFTQRNFLPSKIEIVSMYFPKKI